MILNKICAFVKKEFLNEVSYKFAFSLHILGIFAWIFTFFFIDKLFGSKVVAQLKPFGVNYFSYVLLSFAFFTYVGTGTGGFAARIRNEQLTGTLEALLATPTRISTIIISMGVWGLIWASISLFAYISLGIFFFGINMGNVNILSAFVILILTVTSFSGLGIMAAGFIIILKRGQPITWIVNTLFELFGGVFFPVAVLPTWMQVISRTLPVTYAIKAMQLAVYKGYSLNALITEIAALLAFSATLLPLGLFIFKFALRRAKLEGSLTHY